MLDQEIAVPEAEMPETQAPVSEDPNYNYYKAHYRFNRQYQEVDGKRVAIPARQAIVLHLLVPSALGLINILQGDDQKQKDLIVASIEDVIFNRGRAIIKEDTEESLTADNFPIEQLSFEAIANLTRESRGIDEEAWEAFYSDYRATMEQSENAVPEKIANQVSVLKDRLNPIRFKKKTLVKFKQLLTLYMNSSPNKEEFVDQVTLLVKRLDKFLAAHEDDDVVQYG